MYNYSENREEVFKEENQTLFIGIRDQVHALIDQAGCVDMIHAIQLPPCVGAADSWTMMACVDRLVELGEIKEVSPCSRVRIFVGSLT